MLVTHGSWITATISNLLELDPDGMNALGGMRNACWCRLKVRHSVNGTPIEQPLWELEEYNKAPAIADSADWENGPTDLRGPHMPSWQTKSISVIGRYGATRSTKFERMGLGLISVGTVQR